MNFGRGLTAAVVAAGLSLGFASQASADDFSGAYSLSLSGATGGRTSWTTYSTCPPSGGCVAHITSSSGWSGDAQLAGSQWTMTVQRSDGQSCPDGTRHAELQTRRLDGGRAHRPGNGRLHGPDRLPGDRT